MHRVLYYTLDGDTEPGHRVLRELGCEQEIRLVGQAHAAFVPPTEAMLAGCEAVIDGWSGADARDLERMARSGIRILASRSIGVDHIDLEAASRLGIVVSNCPGYCADDVANHTIALMLDLMRKVTFQNREVLGGAWDPTSGYPVHRPQGSTLGLVFFGSIARRVAPIARALGMRVVCWAPTKTAAELAAAGVEKVDDLDGLLAQADVVSLHCPLIPMTESLIGARELSLMKPTAYLVNTARGGCVDEGALVAALDEGVASRGRAGICAAALDTVRGEEDDSINPRLVAHPRCLVTPHSAYGSVEADLNEHLMTVTAVKELLVDRKMPAYAVNAEAVAPNVRL